MAGSNRIATSRNATASTQYGTAPTRSSLAAPLVRRFLATVGYCANNPPIARL
jgi:hypothetical protein